MESVESRRPPRPGMMFPESFVFDERLRTDSTRSPRIAEVEVAIARTNNFQRGYVFNTGKKKMATAIDINGPTYPPTKPMMLLLGLAATYPLLFFPIVTPKNHAQESHPKMMSRNRQMNALAFEKAAMRLMKEMRQPL